MNTTRGVDHVMIFFNLIVEKISRKAMQIIRKKPRAGITENKKIYVSQAMNMHHFLSKKDCSDSNENKGMTMASPKFLKKIKKTSFVK